MAAKSGSLDFRATPSVAGRRRHVPCLGNTVASLCPPKQMPSHVLEVLRALPEGTHPMTQFAQGILALQAGGGAGEPAAMELFILSWGA